MKSEGINTNDIKKAQDNAVVISDDTSKEKVSADNKNAKSDSGEKSSAAMFSVIESYKMIRTNLLFLLSQSPRKIIEISSSVAGEGKSTTATNIAVAFSQLGSRVLLIDGDLRKPSIHKKLRISNKKGLSSYLVGFAEFDDVVNHINPNFDVITSGPTPPNPSELLGSEKMIQLLDMLNNKYDYVFIDTPPIDIVSDALVISPYTSGIVAVVKDEETRLVQLQKAIDSINFTGTRLLGVILNGSSRKNTKYRYKYRYRRYRNYDYNYNYNYNYK